MGGREQRRWESSENGWVPVPSLCIPGQVTFPPWVSAVSPATQKLAEVLGAAVILEFWSRRGNLWRHSFLPPHPQGYPQILLRLLLSPHSLQRLPLTSSPYSILLLSLRSCFVPPESVTTPGICSLATSLCPASVSKTFPGPPTGNL